MIEHRQIPNPKAPLAKRLENKEITMCLLAAPQSVALPVDFRDDALVGRFSVEPLKLSPLKLFVSA